MTQSNNTIVLLASEESLTFRDLLVPHANPTGAQILEAAKVTRADAILLQRLPSGDLESIRMSEIPNLSSSTEFILAFGDRTYSLFLDAAQMVWPDQYISGTTLRKLGRVPDSNELILTCKGDEPQVIHHHTMVNLGQSGIEKFVTRPKIWKLRVQGVTLDFNVPHVKIGEAMKLAGFDPKKAWEIFLLVEGHPKRAVDINFDVDLSTPGIERIRLMQRNVDNGEPSSTGFRKEFNILPIDEVHLNGTGLTWETVSCNDRRWLRIPNYPLHSNYTPSSVTLALDIPKDYPQAQIDMFYFYPAVTRRDGVVIPNTQVTAVIEGVTFQGWSRHRNGAHPWDSFTDNVATQLALVEYSLAREFGE